MVAPSSIGLRARLFALIALALLPAFALTAYSYLQQRDAALRDAKIRTRVLVRQLAAQSNELVAHNRALLAALAQAPALRRPASAECGSLLAEVMKSAKLFGNLGVADPAGNVVCSAVPLSHPVNVADRAYFRSALAKRDFAVGDYVVGRVSGKPSITFAYPLLEASQVRGLVFAAVNLSWLEHLAEATDLPPDATLAVLDREGTVLATFPPAEGAAGRALSGYAELKSAVADGKDGVIQVAGTDGRPHLFAFARLVGDPAEQVQVIYSLPGDSIDAPANRQLVYGLSALGIAALLVAAAVWIGGEWLVLRNVKSLAETARRFGEGDLKVRTGLAHGNDELGRLARAFDAMADAVEAKEEQLTRANGALRVLSSGNRTLLRATDEATLLAEMCQAVVGIGGYRAAWVGYAENDAARTVRPMAHAGSGDYSSGIDVTWGEGERGRGPTGTAIREGRTVVIDDVLADPALAPWHDLTRRVGCASAIALPLRGQGAVLGALSICAADTHAFDAGQIKLLEEMADDLAYGITSRREAQARERAERELEHQYNYDALTGLANRTLFLDRLLQATVHGARAGRLAAVLLLGLDRFKFINESLGHSAGDALLKHVGQALSAALREGDTVARISGDEFAVVLGDLAHADDVAAIARKVLDAVMRPLTLAGRSITASASMGISVHPKDGDSLEALLQNADAAMNHAKSFGGNTFRFYAPEMNARMVTRFAMEADLRRAIEQGELTLHYQPKVSLASGELTGAEALVRWRHPELGLVPPLDFIGLAEETGLILPLGEWVLEHVCEQVRGWLDAGLAVPPVAVNLSARQFRRDNLVQVIAQVLRIHDLEAKFLELEITESMVMHDLDAAIATLRELAQIGLRLSMDDFGTGYSSLGYLKQFPIDTLKIDRSFVQDITTDPEDAAICLAVIGLAHNLKLAVVAEGVETEAQMNYLRQHGCDEMQGYHFSRPLPAADFAQLLADGRTLALPAAASGKPGLLIVDDEHHVLASLKRLLRRDGYQIHTAESAAAGFEILARHDVQVILCDQRMPEMNGSEFLSRVRDLYPDTIRIVLSGYTDLESITEAVNRGAIYRFLTKPWDDDLLRQHVREAFRHHEAARASGPPG